MKQNNNKKQFNNQNNYFDNEVRRNGEEFAKYKDGVQLQLDSIRILRDLAKNRIDVNKYGKYFLQPSLLEAMMMAAYIKYTKNSTIVKGLRSLMASQDTSTMPLFNDILNDACSSERAYEVILYNLEMLKTSQDINQLIILSSQLNGFKNNI